MTNAKKYLKDHIIFTEFANDLAEYIVNSGRKITEKHDIETEILYFLTEQANPQLTEDERFILRNIDKEAFKTIGRKKSGGLYVRFYYQGETYNASIFNDDVFQFIKERRRIFY